MGGGVDCSRRRSDIAASVRRNAHGRTPCVVTEGAARLPRTAPGARHEGRAGAPVRCQTPCMTLVHARHRRPRRHPHARRPRRAQRADRARWSPRSSPPWTSSRPTTPSGRSSSPARRRRSAPAPTSATSADGRRAPSLAHDLRGLPAHRPLPAADARRRQRRRRRRRHEPGARLRRARSPPAGPGSTPASCSSGSTRAAGTPGCSGASPARRRRWPPVLFGEVLDGAEAERVGLVTAASTTTTCSTPPRPSPRGRRGPAGAGRRDEGDDRDMATSTTTTPPSSRELTPQVWSHEQPWFAERLAALQAKISKS